MGRRKSTYIFAPEKQKSGNLGCLLILVALIAALLAAAFLFNSATNNRVALNSEKVSVMSLDKSYEGFTVLHLSDLHASAIGSDMSVWRSLLYGKTYHAAVLSGDMVGKTGEYEPLVSLIHTLSQINATAPIYFIAGDDDPAPVVTTARGTPEVMADWVIAAKKAGGTYLDVPMSQQVGKKTVWFVPEYLYDVDAAGMLGSLQNQKEGMEALGQQYEAAGGASYRALCYRLDAMARTVEAVKLMTSADLQIAVTHAPLTADYIRTSIEWADETSPFNFRSMSLLLSGHYCAGQWRLPGGGAIYVPDLGWFPSDEGIRGMQRVNSVNQYISSGIGASDFYPMPGRMFNAPAATLLTFTARLQ